MGTCNASVSMHTIGALVRPDGHLRRIDVDLGYDSNDPFAVTLVFHDHDIDVTWTFARETLAAGLTEHSGDGDVQMWPDHGQGEEDILIGQGLRILMLLCGQEGQALVELSGEDIRRFVADSCALVPIGEELSVLDIDLELEALIAT